MYDQDVPFTEYLSNLKEGDVVITVLNSSALSRERVAKVTKTQIVLSTATRYKISDGNKIGGVSWQSDRIIAPTPAVVAEWRKQYLARWADKSFPELFAALTPEQQYALHKQVNEMITENKATTTASPTGLVTDK